MINVADLPYKTQLPFEIIPIRMMTDGFIAAPHFFSSVQLLQPNSPRADYTLSKVIQCYLRYQRTKANNDADAYGDACQTHNSLVAGVRYTVRFGDIVSSNDARWGQSPSITPMHLLEFIDPDGPKTTVLLQSGQATLNDIYVAMRIIDACYATVSHPNDRLSLDLANSHLSTARKSLLHLAKQLVA